MNQLFPFQHSGVEFLTQRNRALLASDPGTGKTVMLIEAVNRVSQQTPEPDVLAVLVLCPKSVRLNWEREIKKWGVSSPWVHWHVHNWDTLLTKAGQGLRVSTWDIVIADESHAGIKNPKAKRCQIFMKEIVPRAERVWLSTATPASKSALDYFCTLQVLMPNSLQNVKPREFEKEYCNEEYCPFSPTRRKYVGFKNTDRLKKVFEKLALRHKKEDVLRDLPEKLYTNLEVEVPADIVAEHLELNEKYVKELIQAGSPLPGHIAHVMQATAMAKLPAALEWIENFPEDESLVIFAWHRSIVESLHEALPGSEMITGATSGLKRQQIVDRFQRKEYKRLVVNMAAGGVGITLTAASTALYVEFPFSPAHLVQSENRIHRIGSTGSHAHIVRMVGKGTVDEAIWAVLHERMKSIREVGV